MQRSPIASRCWSASMHVSCTRAVGAIGRRRQPEPADATRRCRQEPWHAPDASCPANRRAVGPRSGPHPACRPSERSRAARTSGQVMSNATVCAPRAASMRLKRPSPAPNVDHDLAVQVAALIQHDGIEEHGPAWIALVHKTDVLRCECCPSAIAVSLGHDCQAGRRGGRCARVARPVKASSTAETMSCFRFNRSTLARAACGGRPDTVGVDCEDHVSCGQH